MPKIMKHGMYKTAIYQCWRDMIQRCYNPNNSRYKNYGGRGIYVEDYFRGFNGFQHFLDYMGERPDGKSLDRYPDNDRSYVRGNMRWATPKEQAKNTRSLKWFIAYGPNGKVVKSNNQHEIARQHGLNCRAISNCLCRPWRNKSHKGWKFKKVNE